MSAMTQTLLEVNDQVGGGKKTLLTFLAEWTSFLSSITGA